MKRTSTPLEARLRRKHRVRARISGSAARPRLTVYRSAKHIHAQLIDDEAGKTVAAASDMELDEKTVAAFRKGEGERKAKVSVAFEVGKMLGDKAKKAGVAKVVFDRNGFAYAGRVAALADGARESGLEF